MDTKELMIGDWVQIKGHLDYDKVREIAMDENAKWYISFACSATLFRAYEFAPIPLTEEILKVNGLGFKRYDDGYDEWEIQIDSYSSWFIMSITHYIDGAGDWYIEDKPIHYVHELQHALRLCGLTELADNFKLE